MHSQLWLAGGMDPTIHIVFSLKFYFTCLGILPACVCVPADMCCLVFAGARRGSWISWKRSSGQSLVAVWMLGIECVSSGRAASSFNSEPSLQSTTVFLFTYLFIFCAAVGRTWASGMSARRALLPLSYVPVF